MMKAKRTDGSQPTDKEDADSTGLAVRPGSGLATVFDDFFRPFDKLFEPFFQSTARAPISGLGDMKQPILDLHDRGDHLSLTAELPGFTKDEVQVKVDSNSLELRAEKTEEQAKDKDGAYRSSSRSYYQYLSLPDNVLAEKVDGTMKNGILQLKLPKRVSKLKDAARRVDLK